MEDQSTGVLPPSVLCIASLDYRISTSTSLRPRLGYFRNGFRIGASYVADAPSDNHQKTHLMSGNALRTFKPFTWTRTKHFHSHYRAHGAYEPQMFNRDQQLRYDFNGLGRSLVPQYIALLIDYKGYTAVPFVNSQDKRVDDPWVQRQIILAHRNRIICGMKGTLANLRRARALNVIHHDEVMRFLV